jgi:hypothetical protein
VLQKYRILQLPRYEPVGKLCTASPSLSLRSQGEIVSIKFYTIIVLVASLTPVNASSARWSSISALM